MAADKGQLQADLNKAKRLLKMSEDNLRSAQRQGNRGLITVCAQDVNGYKKEIRAIEAEMSGKSVGGMFGISGSGLSSAVPTMFAGSGSKLGAAIGGAKVAGAVGGAALRGAGSAVGATAGLVGGVGGKAKALLVGGALGATSFAFANSEFVFIGLAILKYIFDWLGLFSGVMSIFSIFLLFFGIATVLNGKGYVPAILVMVQLNFYGLTFAPAMATTYAIVISVCIVFFGVDRIKEDLKNLQAYLAIIIYSIDTGIFSLIAKQYGLVMQPWFEKFILLTPWWVLFGVILVNIDNIKSGFSRTIIKILKPLAMVYLITLIVASTVPQGAFTEAGPGLDDAQKARDEALAQLKNQIHPLRVMWISIMCSVSEPTALEQCKLRETIAIVCKEPLEIGREAGIADEENDAYQECAATVMGGDQTGSKKLVGGIDPSIIRFTKIEIGDPKSKVFDQRNTLVPLGITAETPRKVELEVGCSFISGKNTIKGTAQPSTFSIDPTETGTVRQLSFICSPESQLPAGSVKVKTEVLIKNMQTTSRLARAFIGPEITPEVKAAIKDYFPIESISPNEFAAIVFSIEGTESETSSNEKLPKSIISIESGSATFTADIKNNGEGKITLVDKAQIALVDGLVPDEQQCNMRIEGNNLVREGFIFTLKDNPKTLPLGVCVLRFDDPLVSKVPVDGYLNVDNIIATLDYSYSIEKESSISILGDSTQAVTAGIG